MNKTILLLLLLIQSVNVFSADLADFQKRWAVANYELTDEEQAAAFELLIADLDKAVAGAPGDAELLIWKAIIESTYAGKASGFSALGLVKSARDSLEAALEIDAGALNGSAYTSLGALYYQVPSWPIAFGSNKKARKLLMRALEANPDGIDPNFFYGAFLVEEKEYAEAKAALLKAMAAPARPGRELADRGRRMEIRQLLDELSEKGI